MTRPLLLTATLFLAGCSSSPTPAPEPAPLPVKDNSAKFPLAGRVSSNVVPNHFLGLKKLPGATVADYSAYQLFIIEADSTQNAAFLLMDLKNSMNGPEYLPNMGGYVGVSGGKPIYAFAKLQYLAGVVGLPKEQADPIARQLAARLR